MRLRQARKILRRCEATGVPLLRPPGELVITGPYRRSTITAAHQRIHRRGRKTRRALRLFADDFTAALMSRTPAPWAGLSRASPACTTVADLAVSPRWLAVSGPDATGPHPLTLEPEQAPPRATPTTTDE